MAVYCWIQIQAWCLFLVSVCSQDAQEGVHRLKPALLPSKFAFLIVHFLYFGLSCVYVPATFVCPSQEDVILHELAQGTWQFTGADVWSQPKVTLLLPWGWDEFSFLYNTFSPRLTGLCPLPLWGASQAHCPGWESPGSDKFLSPEWCPWENPTSAWDVLWGQMGCTWQGWINLVCSCSGSLGSCARQVPGEGSFLHTKKLLLKEFKYWEAPDLELVHTPERPGVHEGLWGSVLLISEKYRSKSVLGCCKVT